MSAKGIAEEYPKYLELPRDLLAEAERRQNASMVDSGPWEDWLPEIIFQNFVVWPLKEEKRIGQRYKNKKSIHFLTRDALKFIQENHPKAAISDQSFSIAMSKLVVLAKERCQGLHEDITGGRLKLKGSMAIYAGIVLTSMEKAKRTLL